MSEAVTDATRRDEPARSRLTEGTRVEVRSGFDDSWSSGFEVEEVTETGYRLRRRSDSRVLPAEFPVDNVRRERKPMWWV